MEGGKVIAGNITENNSALFPGIEAGLSNTLDAPSSLSDSLLNLNPLGSLPTNWCVRSVPRSCRATLYARGFTHDCRQKGTLVSPTECLHDVRMYGGWGGKLQMRKQDINEHKNRNPGCFTLRNPSYLCPSTVQRETPHSSGLNLAN